MTYRGRFQNGVVVLKDATGLSEGAEVEVAPVDAPATASEPAAADAQPSWAEVLKDVIGKADGLPSDSSRNHDHYLYGTAKR
jgi:hypothetical protein